MFRFLVALGVALAPIVHAQTTTTSGTVKAIPAITQHGGPNDSGVSGHTDTKDALFKLSTDNVFYTSDGKSNVGSITLAATGDFRFVKMTKGAYEDYILVKNLEGGYNFTPKTTASVTGDPEKKQRVDRLSDEEYGALQKIKKELADKQEEIARAHGVNFGSQNTCFQNVKPGELVACTAVYIPYVAPDNFTFVGQFLLINLTYNELPKASLQ